ncbi:hypothetical protein HF295_04465 [Hujiaoplasma nucleasis]|uniref:Uncharacterized protein n=1 Tax=Hujiaoplasma nucleasis TaxID=2725268 RepID=A0A7L6N1V6_9MOLU|nr:hypothetical protein [Hujiaoplasma nucleasis]QLY40153.1 hypothetical protein HF295_04465 [Hujiaoplasma nucleasis]
MNIEEIIRIELEGISQTIIQYTNDNFIKSYAKQILSIEYPSDKQLLEKLVSYLVDWYSKKIDVIESSDYVVSKDAHYKSYEILKELKEQLNNYN